MIDKKDSVTKKCTRRHKTAIEWSALRALLFETAADQIRQSFGVVLLDQGLLCGGGPA